MFVTMQSKRHSADYDPHFKTTKSEVLLLHAAVGTVIKNFGNVPVADRRAFAAFVLLKLRS